MRAIYLILIPLCCFTSVYYQNKFELKFPNVKKLQEITTKTNMEANVVALYLDNAYKAITDKTNIKLDSLFNNKICGYSKKYNFGILYKYSNCGEAAPIIQEITFPKTKTSILKKWIKLMYKSNLPADAIIETEWHNENEYGPKGGEAGCYYKIKQTKNNSKIEIWCGC